LLVDTAMGRPLRVFVEGLSLHVFNRGLNHLALFDEEGDYEEFLETVKCATASEGVAVHGFVLMTTHYHLQVTPKDKSALPRAMQRIDGGYVRYFNRKHERQGTVWNGRYKAILIEDQNYWLTCLRYTDQNPVRAHMVRSAEAYPWSSYRAHALGDGCSWLEEHHCYRALGSTHGERQAAYRAICGVPLTPSELTLQRLPPRRHRREPLLIT
jgi:putative transposase